MYKNDPVFVKPKNKNTIIWRYIDFTKFASLLDKSALFFAPAKQLGDPFEGSYTKLDLDFRRYSFPDFLEFRKRRGYEDELGKNEFLQGISLFNEYLTNIICINSWHINKSESAAMWKIYLKSNEGIAIQSTYDRLKSSLKDEEHDVYIGKVAYVDYNKHMMSKVSIYDPFLHKRRSFEYEHELRAITEKKSSANKELDLSAFLEAGIYMIVDLDILISKIYLAPTSPKWLFELVESVTRKYGLNKEVQQSSLEDVPVY